MSRSLHHGGPVCVGFGGRVQARVRVWLHRGVLGRRRPYDYEYMAGEITSAQWEDSLQWDRHRW